MNTSLRSIRGDAAVRLEPATDAQPHEVAASIPWNPAVRVAATHGVADWLRAAVAPEHRAFVPRSITLFRADDAPRDEADALLALLRTSAPREFARWLERAARFERLGLFAHDDVRARIVARDDVHPWALCVTARGGLGPFAHNAIPCIAVKNHAIAWLPTDGADAGVSYLVTARPTDGGWDPEDLGHECGHATTFAIALCAQDGGVTDALPDALRPELLTANHVRKLHYTLAEGANAVVRGEARANATGFTVLHTRDELVSFLRWCHVLFPCDGFDAAQVAYEAHGQEFIPMDQDIAFRVGAPFLRATGRLVGNLRRLGTPTLAWVR